MVYPDFGAYTGAYAEQAARFPNLHLPGKTADLDAKFGPGNWPTLNNYQTWRDSWLSLKLWFLFSLMKIKRKFRYNRFATYFK